MARLLRTSLQLQACFLLVALYVARGQNSANDTGANTASSAGPAGSVPPSTAGPGVVAGPVVTNTPADNSTASTGANSATSSPGSAGNNATSSPLASGPAVVSVDELVPHFNSVRSCLPFNILLAAPQKPAGVDGSNLTSSGRITITADPAVINATGVAVEDGTLVLSLTGSFFSNQPINFTVTIPPSGGEFQSVSNHGSGMVVLGPGLNTSSLRISAASVGQVRAINVSANTLVFSGSGVLGSVLAGAFNEVYINTGAATGSVALSSVTPVNASINLGGITTLLVDGPAGTMILGKAAGLSKVQYTNGQCTLTSESGSLLPSSSLFGSSGDIFGSNKCSKVSATTLAESTAAATNPQWTCGVVVDGQLSCAGSNVSSRQEVPLVVTGNAGQPGDASGAGTNEVPQQDTGNFTTPPENFTTPTGNAAGQNTGSTGANGGTNGNATGSLAPNAAGGNSASSPTPNAAGVNTATSPSPSAGGNTGSNSFTSTGPASPAPATGGNAGTTSTGTSSSPSPAPSANTTGSPSPLTTIIGGGGTTGGNAATTGSGSTQGSPANAGTGGRRMLRKLKGGRHLKQDNFFSSFPSLPLTTTFTPSGTLSTGTYTSGPGASASSSSSTSGSGGTSYQTSTSQGGSPPVTVTGGNSLYNPVYIPSGNFAASPAPPPSPSSQPNSSAPSPSPASGLAQATSVSISTGNEGASGIAVVNTQCAVSISLNMLLPAEEAQGTAGSNAASSAGDNGVTPNAANTTNGAGTGNAAVGTGSTGNATNTAGSAGDNTTAGGTTAGGNTAGGNTAGGTTAGGNTAGGNTAGGTTAGNSTTGGNTAGGDTAGGNTAGNAAGSSTVGGNTANTTSA